MGNENNVVTNLYLRNIFACQILFKNRTTFDQVTFSGIGLVFENDVLQSETTRDGRRPLR